jgi:hypothetical protein
MLPKISPNFFIEKFGCESLQILPNLITPQKKVYQISTGFEVVLGRDFLPDFSTVLTVFQNLVVINAISLLG